MIKFKDILNEEIKIKPNDWLNPKNIEPPHEVRDNKKLNKIIENMKLKGYYGRPILIVNTFNGYFALTGSHRLAATKKLNMHEIPVYIIDESDFNDYLDKINKDAMEFLYLDKYKIEKHLKNIDKKAYELMKYENKKDDE